MSTYAISDIHGAYDEFQRLLDKIGFRYDGSDELFLLGDYGDWGEKSMDTILAVMQMDGTYDFVHCLRGNHEMMFLSAIENGISGDEVSPSAENWLVANHGLVTWNAYTQLSNMQRGALREWLRRLPFSMDKVVGEKHFMLTHAYPYFEDMAYTEEERQWHKTDALWRRLLLHEDPFGAYTGAQEYDMFICGHTITDYYYREMQKEEGVPSPNLMPGGRNRIFRAHRFIDIDCGAKCMSMTDFDTASPVGVMKAILFERAQLAAYCLDTDEEFYIGSPKSIVGEILRGDIVPGLETPALDFSPRQGHESAGRDWRIPGMERAKKQTVYPELEAPEIGMPDWDSPKAPWSRWTHRENVDQ